MDNAKRAARRNFRLMWQPIGTESYDVWLELAVIVDGQVEWSLGPCRRVIGGWVHCDTHEAVPRRPTHWRLAQTSPDPAMGERSAGG